MKSLKKEIFTKFYAIITKDVHSKRFFNSKLAIDELIDKQIYVLDKVYFLLKENKDNEAKKILTDLANKHFTIGLCEHIILNAIDIYINLIKEYKDKLNLNQTIINKMYNLLKETTFTEYAKKYLKILLENIKENEENNSVIFYDKILFDSLTLHVSDLINSIENKAECINEKEDKFSKFINSFSFEVLTINFIDLNINLKIKYNLLHQYMIEFITYTSFKEYSNALHLLQKTLSLVQEIINLYFIVSNNFKKNPENIFYKYIKQTQTLSLLILNFQTNKNSFFLKKLNKFLIRYYTINYNFFIFNQKDEKIFILFNNKLSQFNEKINELIEKIKEKVTKNLKSFTLNETYLKIAKIDFSHININEEETEEIFHLIYDKLKNETSKEIIVFYHFKEELYDFLKEAKKQLKLKHLILKAIEEENIDIFIHKMFDEDKNIAGGEILARIKMENKEYIPAYLFIPLIIRKNLMSKLDKIILKKVIKNIDKIKKLTPRLFVNIFPLSLNNSEITELIIELADKLYKNNIEFFLELTEYAITANKNILNLLEKSKKLYLAFDDFGTGYTNYELVGELATNKNAKVIKIDGSLVKKITKSKIYYSIVSSISEFAKELDMYIVYEFVENEEIFNALKNITKKLKLKKEQILFYQGWFFDKAEKI